MSRYAPRYEVIPQAGGQFGVYDNRRKTRVAAGLDKAQANKFVTDAIGRELDGMMLKLIRRM